MQNNKIFRITIGLLFPLIVTAVLSWAFFVKYPLPCVIYKSVGHLCPMCGATRAVIAILHGDFSAATGYNAYVTLTAPLWIFLFLYIYFGVVFGYIYRISDKSKLSIAALTVILIFFLLLFGIIRNIL